MDFEISQSDAFAAPGLHLASGIFGLTAESGLMRAQAGKGYMKKAVFALLLFFVGSATVSAQVPYFQGKTVTIIVGYQAGDGYDIWARLLAAHLGKHIPGSPAMIVQNMPGAGSMIAANYIYNVAKPDGFTLGVYRPVALYRSARRQEGSAVRLGQVRLGRFNGKYAVAALHENRYAV